MKMQKRRIARHRTGNHTGQRQTRRIAPAQSKHSFEGRHFLNLEIQTVALLPDLINRDERHNRSKAHLKPDLHNRIGAPQQNKGSGPQHIAHGNGGSVEQNGKKENRQHNISPLRGDAAPR